MLRFLTALSLLLAVVAGCGAPRAEVQPIPGSGHFGLDSARWIVVERPELEEQALLLADRIERLTGIDLDLRRDPAPGSIQLDLYEIALGALGPEAYSFAAKEAETLVLAAGTPAGMARASADLLRRLEVDPYSGSWSVRSGPSLVAPKYPWRGISLDLARFPHPVEAVEEVIELAFLFSLNPVHLHLTDDQAFTFPTSLLPPRTAAGQAGPNRGYTRAELEHLIDYAEARGVTLVPEIDLPAHSSALVNARPDLFGTVDDRGQPKSTHVVNMASERAYTAVDQLIGEVAEVFAHSSFLHLGGDEVWAPHLLETPEFAALAKEQDLPLTVEAGAVDALLNHFLVRATEMVRRRGLRPVVWEGFRPPDDPRRAIGSDVLVMSWSQNSQTPEALLEAGYTLVNCGWDPLYIVPAQGWAARPDRAFDWDPTRIRQRFGGRVSTLPPGAPLAGAQICVWEQRPEALVPSLLRLLPELAERMGQHESEFHFHEQRSALARRLLRPVTAHWTREGGGRGTAFTGPLSASLASEVPGTIRYELGTFDDPVTANSTPYSGAPIPIESSQVLSAKLFQRGPDGMEKPVGGTTRVRFERAPVLFECEVFELEPGPEFDWASAWERPFGRGRLIYPTAERVDAINRELFAKVNPAHHVDTRPLIWQGLAPGARLRFERPRVWGRHAMKIRGQISIPTAGRWKLSLGTRGGAARLRLAGATVECGSEPVEVELDLPEGAHPIEIDVAVLGVHNDLQVALTAPGGGEPRPLVDLILPLESLP